MFKRIGIAVVVIGVIGLGVVSVWSSRSPFELKLVSIEPSGMKDAGGEALMVTLNISNRDSVAVMFEKGTTLQARITNRWVELEQAFDSDRIVAGRKSEVMLVMPAGTDACRLCLNYQSETWKSRLMVILGLPGRRLLAKSPLWVREFVWPDQMKTMRVPPRWRPITPEVALPNSNATPAETPARAQNR